MTIETVGNMAGRSFKTLTDRYGAIALQQACALVNSNFQIILNPGDSCFGSDGKAKYNKGVTGRFVKTIVKETDKEDTVTWVEKKLKL